MKTADLVDEYDDKVELCHLPFIKCGQRRAFYGPVQTIKCFEDNGLVKAELQKSGDGRVLVVDAAGSTRTAIIGDMIAGFMHDNGWAGAVINGAIRDSVEIDAMDVGVRCLGTSPKKSAKHGAGRIGETVAFGGVHFHPGDWIYVDEDGILVSRVKLL